MDVQDETSGRRGSSYEVHRIAKPDMFMAVALWMERSPLAQDPSKYFLTQTTQQTPVINKAGAVVVLPNDRALSVDCSRDGVHAAVSALNKFGQERVKGCQVYLSRRPCSFCAKLLVQCEVSKVFYLPIEPERNDPDDVRRVDTMFMTSSVGLSVRVPRVSRNVFQDHRQSPYMERLPDVLEEEFRLKLLREYWDDEWIKHASEVLNWPAFRDKNTHDQIKTDIESLMRWIARTTVQDVPHDIEFMRIEDHTYKQKKEATEGNASSDSPSTAAPQQGGCMGTDDPPVPMEGNVGPLDASPDSPSTAAPQQGGCMGTDDPPVPMEDNVGPLDASPDSPSTAAPQQGGCMGTDDPPVPTEGNVGPLDASPGSPSTAARQQGGCMGIDDPPMPENGNWQKHALHMSRLAQMLSQRSDDPIRGVGCVLLVRSEVVAIGWNGFPSKALYGEFPRASNSDEASREHYVIHAEQNALLTRNKRNLKHESSVLFINEVPCNECVPMLLQAGVRNVVIPKLEKIGKEISSQRVFKRALDKKRAPDTDKKMLTCFGSKRGATAHRRNLDNEF